MGFTKLACETILGIDFVAHLASGRRLVPDVFHRVPDVVKPMPRVVSQVSFLRSWGLPHALAGSEGLKPCGTCGTHAIEERLELQS